MGINFDLGVFREFSLGKNNIGNIVIGKNADGKAELTKVNNHKWFFWKNTAKSDATQNRAVREAFYAAIVAAVHGKFGTVKGPNEQEDTVNPKLKEIRDELLSGNNAGLDLTRELTHDILKKVDNVMLSKSAVVAGNIDNLAQVQPNRQNFGNAKTIARRAGVPVAAVNRLLADENTAIQNLMAEKLVAGQYDANNQSHQDALTEVIQQLAGKNRLSEGDFANQDVGKVFKLLNNGFSNESFGESDETATNLLGKLNELTGAQVGGSVQIGEGQATVTLTKQKNGTLAVSFGKKTKAFPLPVSQYADRLEKALILRQLKATNPNNVMSASLKALLVNLNTRWRNATENGAKPSYALTEHCRAIATAVLTKNIQDVDPKLCARIPTSNLMGFMAQLCGNQGVRPTKGDLATACVPIGEYSVEFKELLDCNGSNGAQGGNEAAQGVDDNAFLHKIARGSQRIEGGEIALQNKDDRIKLINLVKSYTVPGANIANLTPLSRMVIKAAASLLARGTLAKFVGENESTNGASKHAMGMVKFCKAIKCNLEIRDLQAKLNDPELDNANENIYNARKDELNKELVGLCEGLGHLGDLKEPAVVIDELINHMSPADKVKLQAEVDKIIGKYGELSIVNSEVNNPKVARIKKLAQINVTGIQGAFDAYKDALVKVSGGKSSDNKNKADEDYTEYLAGPIKTLGDNTKALQKVLGDKTDKEIERELEKDYTKEIIEEIEKAAGDLKSAANRFGYNNTLVEDRSGLLDNLRFSYKEKANSLVGALESPEKVADAINKQILDDANKAEGEKQLEKTKNELESLCSSLASQFGFGRLLSADNSDNIAGIYSDLVGDINRAFVETMDIVGKKLDTALGSAGVFKMNGSGELPAEAPEDFKFLIEADSHHAPLHMSGTKENFLAIGGGSLAYKNAILDPTKYTTQCACEGGNNDGGEQRRIVKEGHEDAFELLAATIVSPEKIRSCFSEETSKPSVEGAFDIVHEILSNIEETFADSSPNDIDQGPKLAYENLKKFLSGDPPSLNAEVVVDAIRTSVEKLKDGAFPLPIDSLLMRLPGPAVSMVLKNLCRYLICRENHGARQDANDVSFLPGHSKSVFDKIEAWREPIGSLAGKTTPSGYSLKEFVTLPTQPVLANGMTRFDKLDPDRMDAVREIQTQKSGGGQFVKNLIKDYVKEIGNNECLRAKVMMALADEPGGLQKEDGDVDWKFFGKIVRGFGPIMQKYLQGVEIPDTASPEMRDVFNGIKSNLPQIPRDVINAQIAYIKEMSGGRITDITIEKSLGAATVGEAVLCNVKTVDNPNGEECVIKFIRPDVRVRMAEEQAMIKKILAGRGNSGDRISKSNKARIESISQELDMLGEFNGLGQGEAYNGKSPDVVSVKPLPFVVPSSNFIIMKKAKGNTVDEIVSLADKTAKDFAANNGKIRKHNNAVGVALAAELKSQVNSMWTWRWCLLEARKQLESAIKIWFNEALKGSGFYHGDLHAGNILSHPSLATLIDFGNFGTLNQSQQKAFRRIFSGIWKKKTQDRIDGVRAGILALVPQSSRDAFADAMNKPEFKEILDAGKSPDEILMRLEKALDYLVSKELTIPPVLSNFMAAQKRLANTLREVNQSLRKLDESLLSMTGDKWYLEKWPVPKSVAKAWGDQLKGEWGDRVRSNLPDEDSVRAFNADCNELAENLVTEIKPLSYASVIGEIAKGLQVN